MQKVPKEGHMQARISLSKKIKYNIQIRCSPTAPPQQITNSPPACTKQQLRKCKRSWWWKTSSSSELYQHDWKDNVFHKHTSLSDKYYPTGPSHAFPTLKNQIWIESCLDLNSRQAERGLDRSLCIMLTRDVPQSMKFKLLHHACFHVRRNGAVGSHPLHRPGFGVG